MFRLKIFVQVQTFRRVPPCSRATSATLTQALCRKEIILVWVSALATWILQTGRVLFFLHLRLFHFLFLVCTVHFASSWFSMVYIDLGSSLMQEEIILILVSASATWILQPRERYALVPLLIEFRIS